MQSTSTPHTGSASMLLTVSTVTHSFHATYGFECHSRFLLSLTVSIALTERFRSRASADGTARRLRRRRIRVHSVLDRIYHALRRIVCCLRGCIAYSHGVRFQHSAISHASRRNRSGPNCTYPCALSLVERRSSQRMALLHVFR